jgi:hypothetical protein
LSRKQEAAEQKRLAELKKKTELASAAAAVKATILSEASKAAPVDAAALPSADASPTTLMKEATGTLRKATVTTAGDLKEELVDRAPVLIDKAEVMQVIHISNASVVLAPSGLYRQS